VKYGLAFTSCSQEGQSGAEDKHCRTTEDAHGVGNLAHFSVCDHNGRRWFEKHGAVSHYATKGRNENANYYENDLHKYGSWFLIFDL
jgi:hypothetical protein